MIPSQADTQGSICGDLLIEQAEMASLLTESLEDLINQYGAFSEEGRVGSNVSCNVYTVQCIEKYCIV